MRSVGQFVICSNSRIPPSFVCFCTRRRHSPADRYGGSRVARGRLAQGKPLPRKREGDRDRRFGLQSKLRALPWPGGDFRRSCSRSALPGARRTGRRMVHRAHSARRQEAGRHDDHAGIRGRLHARSDVGNSRLHRIRPRRLSACHARRLEPQDGRACVDLGGEHRSCRPFRIDADDGTPARRRDRLEGLARGRIHRQRAILIRGGR